MTKALEDRVADLERRVGMAGFVWAQSGGGHASGGGGQTTVLAPRRRVTETVIVIANDGDGEPFESLPSGGAKGRLVPASGRVRMPNGITFYIDPTVFSHVECGKDGGALVTPISTPDGGTTVRFMRASEIDLGKIVRVQAADVVAGKDVRLSEIKIDGR